ncbi:MAG: hypothetical protein WA709_28255 [Stellaceae bacterium]
MTRSKLSHKVIFLATGIGLSAAAFAASQPAAAQSYSDDYTCPAGTVYDPTYGCTLPGEAYEPYDYGYYGYLPDGSYGAYNGGHRAFGHGFGHGMGGFNHGVGFAHGGGGDFGHGMGGGFGHGGGGGHR